MVRSYLPELYLKADQFSVNPDDIKLSTAASPLLVGGTSELDIEPISLLDAEKFISFHPVIPRGIEIKANRITSRGYIVSGEDEKSVEYCRNILLNSGGTIFLNRWIRDTIAFGNGFGELVPNKAMNEILFVDIKHPVYFTFLKEKMDDKWKIIIDNKTQKPKAYSQYIYENEEMTPTGKAIPTDRIAHLVFDRWGDELEGISIMQYLQSTLSNIINIENAGAQAGYLAGNPRYKFTTNIKDRGKLQEFADSVRGINERDAIILTEGSDAEILSPGITNFPEYHERFLTLLAVKLGVPKPLLTMDSTSTNKATLTAQLQFITEENKADEEVIKQTIENQIFEVACKLKFGENYEKIPSFNFNDFGMEEEIFIQNSKIKAETIKMLIESAMQLDSMNKPETSQKIYNYIDFMIGKENDISKRFGKETGTVSTDNKPVTTEEETETNTTPIQEETE